MRIIFNFQFSIFNKGQSMFEVIFAIGIAALILVGMISLAATSVSNSTYSRNNALGTKYVQEASEWIREQRDISWTNLSSRSSGGGTTTNIGSLSWGGSCTINGTKFCRNVILKSISADTIEATIIVTWQDNQGTHETRSVTRYTNWNR